MSHPAALTYILADPDNIWVQWRICWIFTEVLVAFWLYSGGCRGIQDNSKMELQLPGGYCYIVPDIPSLLFFDIERCKMYKYVNCCIIRHVAKVEWSHLHLIIGNADVLQYCRDNWASDRVKVQYNFSLGNGLYYCMIAIYKPKVVWVKSRYDQPSNVTVTSGSDRTSCI